MAMFDMTEKPIKAVGKQDGMEYHYASGKVVFVPKNSRVVAVDTSNQIRPTVFDLVKSATEATKRIILSGVAVAPDHVIKQRLAICAEPCPHLDHQSRCVHLKMADGSIEKGCGCYMPVKVTFAAMKCPIGKW